jgi:hypothetical protein
MNDMCVAPMREYIKVVMREKGRVARKNSLKSYLDGALTARPIDDWFFACCSCCTSNAHYARVN